MLCPHCCRAIGRKDGRSSAETQRFECPLCNRKFSENTRTGILKGIRTPPEQIAAALTFIKRYKLSSREASSILCALFKVRRSHATLIKWVHRYGSQLRHLNRRCKIKVGLRWDREAMIVFSRGKKFYVRVPGYSG